MVKQYLEHSKEILSSKYSKFKFNERRGLGRIYLFGYQNRYNLKEGFPLLTTKKIHFKSVAHELIWFLSGKTNIKYLADNNVHIWDDDAFNYNLKKMVKSEIFPEVFPKYSEEWVKAKAEYVQKIKEDEKFAAKWGDLGPVYGSQWIHWPKFIPVTLEINGEKKEYYTKDSNGINQLESVIQGMKKDVASARHIVSAWNPQEVPDMALPPCHTIFQFNSDGKQLDLHLYQRACDMFLGVPFNIASYSLLTTIFAKELKLEPGEFVHTFGDVHFYCGAGARAKWYERNFEEFKDKIRNVNNSEDYLKILDWLNQNIPKEDKGKEGMDHVTGIIEQLIRTPKKLPKIIIADKSYKELTIDDFVLENYNPEPTIKRALAV
ncbi:MAG TPA: thymidylate synthase [Candidatus Nanoarchaeia archaeon]|nr:thymidylate synthase [Candidatus Nanoarchaeia archaeon]